MTEGFDRIDLLKKLTEARGVSGNEGEVRKLIRAALEGHVDALETDTLGNLVATKRAAGQHSGTVLKVLLAAHMDEAGFMVISVEKDGYIRVHRIGALDERYLISKPVKIGKDGVAGIIGVKPVHLLEGSERQQVMRANQFTIDVGAESDGGTGVKMGDYVTFATPFEVRDHRVDAKALSNRVGCALLIELLRTMEQAPQVELHVAFTVQELVGARGARAVGYHYAPDVAIAIGTTLADDTPLPEDIHLLPLVRLGGGPAVTIYDRMMMADRNLLRFLDDTAQAAGISLQTRQPGTGHSGSDAGSIHLTREGVPSTTISLPCRYMTAPSGIVDLRDYDATLTLLRAALAGIQSANLQPALP